MRHLAALVAAVALAGGALAPVASAEEPTTGAHGRPFRGADAHGAVRGFVDAHLHITADVRAGGRVISGKPSTASGSPRRSATTPRSTAPTAAPT